VLQCNAGAERRRLSRRVGITCSSQGVGKRRNILYHHHMSQNRLTTLLPPKRMTAQQQLWAAVLDNAVRGLEQRGIFNYGKDYNITHQKRTLRDESLTWLQSQLTTLGSFIFICDTLCIDPDFLRERLLRKYAAVPGTAETDGRVRRFRATIS